MRSSRRWTALAAAALLGLVTATPLVAQTAPPDPLPEVGGPTNVFYGAVPPSPPYEKNTTVLVFVHGLHGTAMDWWVQNDENRKMFEKYFGHVRTANFAIAGDTTQGVLWGLKHGEGQGFQPKAVMLMIGTNNTFANTAPEIAEGIGAIVLELRTDFPDAKILLPIRHPLGQARSLLQQHCRFLQMHEEQPFVRRYMGDIGHYEFGELHRPIGFSGLEPLITGRDPRTLDYWLAYWIAAFEHVLSRSHNGIVVSYEACCRAPRQALSEICARLDIPEEDHLNEAAALFRSAPPATGREVDVNRELAERAVDLHDALLRANAS